MAVAWSDSVNTKAFNVDTGYKDNLVKIKFESGKERSYMMNSKAKKTFSFSLSLDNTATSNGLNEYETFLKWYEDILLSGAMSFLFPDLITKTGNKEYILTDTPKFSGQRTKTASLSVEEL